MYIIIFLLLFAVGYIFYLRKQVNELSNLQKTIALLQEQTLLFEGIGKRIEKLEKEGISIIVPANYDVKGVEDKGKRLIKILSQAYFKGWYKFSMEQRKEIHSNRELIENKNIQW
ncbi:hypothetical protein KJ980_08550 [Patescibacteria group bacterium]|nr:hypothetical protein [Patescibacteria group bacterium]MBU4099664.1 hypothetical protein [Patescibacteria group bacterium]